jgi:hypothetical protein
VNNIIILKAAYNIGNGIDLANMAEKLIPQPLTFACPFYGKMR